MDSISNYLMWKTFRKTACFGEQQLIFWVCHEMEIILASPYHTVAFCITLDTSLCAPMTTVLCSMTVQNLSCSEFGGQILHRSSRLDLQMLSLSCLVSDYQMPKKPFLPQVHCYDKPARITSLAWITEIRPFKPDTIQALCSTDRSGSPTLRICLGRWLRYKRSLPMHTCAKFQTTICGILSKEGTAFPKKELHCETRVVSAVKGEWAPMFVLLMTDYGYLFAHQCCCVACTIWRHHAVQHNSALKVGTSGAFCITHHRRCFQCPILINKSSIAIYAVQHEFNMRVQPTLG